MVRTKRGYGNSIRTPQNEEDKDKLERIQRRATRAVPRLKGKSYEERLKCLKLPTPHFRT